MVATPESSPAVEFETQDLLLNVGPQHPSTHGVFRMVLQVDGEVVRDVIPYIGYLHRGAEKLCETMDFRQGIGFMDRTEYLAAHNAELSYVMAVEALAEIEVPERAQWIRMILCELNRLSSHFMFMGAFGIDVGVFATPFIYAWKEREQIIDLFEEISGDRMMYAYFRPGGLAWDVPVNFKQRVREVLKSVKVGIKDFDGLLTENEIFRARTQGVGVISPEEAIEWGMSGPSLRGSGVEMDVRKDEPYLFYDQIDFNVPTRTEGDVFARYACRMDEMWESVKIIEQCLEKMPDYGPIMPEKMPRMLRTPPGEVYIRTEAPRGEYGIYMVSEGGNRPYRLKVRSACLSNLQALRDMSVGQYLADAIIVLGSIDIVLSEVDR
ncbi:MAG: NADH-quinone oxidoreductase subunit D [Dehalococcoidia bacterium]|nr:NADH-quinone oxidoreductase subunit D [Dehalococcoidia bacterium]MCB9484407.1 NADH-quinone oxidoreductase subunit D [Dehalococcoidia bacterium]